VTPLLCCLEQRPGELPSNVGPMPLSQRANLARVKAITRELDEMCMAAARLRRRIQRDMRAARARDEIGFRDDRAVTAAREHSRVRKSP
jgi:hypothetical protein